MKTTMYTCVILLSGIFVGSCGSSVSEMLNPPPAPNTDYAKIKHVFMHKGTMTNDSTSYYRANDTLDGYFYTRKRKIVLNLRERQSSKAVHIDTFDTRAWDYFSKGEDDIIREVSQLYDIDQILIQFR